MQRSIVMALALAAFLWSCQAIPDEERETLRSVEASSASEAHAKSEEPAESRETVWAYLAAKYDENGDGQVAPHEYDRGGATFERLDNNDDGVINEGDWQVWSPSFGGSPLGDGGPAQEMILSRMIMRLFDADGTVDRLDLDELAQSWAARDTNVDGALDEAEFAALLAQRESSTSDMFDRILGGEDSLDFLAEGIGAGAADRVTEEELMAFFHAQDADGNGVWERASPMMEMMGELNEDEISGPPQGAEAPDFTLPLLESETEVTLSSFQGDRPVALIFGSYT